MLQLFCRIVSTLCMKKFRDSSIEWNVSSTLDWDKPKDEIGIQNWKKEILCLAHAFPTKHIGQYTTASETLDMIHKRLIQVGGTELANKTAPFFYLCVMGEVDIFIEWLHEQPRVLDAERVKEFYLDLCERIQNNEPSTIRRTLERMFGVIVRFETRDRLGLIHTCMNVPFYYDEQIEDFIILGTFHFHDEWRRVFYEKVKRRLRGLNVDKLDRILKQDLSSCCLTIQSIVYRRKITLPGNTYIPRLMSGIFTTRELSPSQQYVVGFAFLTRFPIKVMDSFGFSLTPQEKRRMKRCAEDGRSFTTDDFLTMMTTTSSLSQI